MQIKKVISGGQVDMPSFFIPKTIILGFSKGGTVLDQIVTELGFADIGPNVSSAHDICIVPKTKESLLNSISEIHYVDVGLNSTGAYLTNHDIYLRESPKGSYKEHVDSVLCFMERRDNGLTSSETGYRRKRIKCCFSLNWKPARVEGS